MLTVLLTTVLTVAPAHQDREPSEEQVKAAVAALEEAFGKGKSPERIAALQAGAQVLDAAVIEWIGKGLKDRDAEVQKASIESLRSMPHPDALAALHKSYKRDKKLLAHEELGPALLRAIGQHGSESSIEVLADNPFSPRNHKAIQARILGLGNIRSNESVEELMGLMVKVGRHKAQPYMGEFRLALMRLTGADNGKSVDLWTEWWNDAKKHLEVSKEPPLLPKGEQRQWDHYWGNPRKHERGKRRGDRGDDGDS
jgi:hypothetical protein